MQNPYNNYLKRQKQTSTNNFKEKVANSLAGKTLNNTTTPNVSNPVANKLRAVSNISTQGSTINSNTPQITKDTNTQQVITTPPTPQETPQNTINEVAPVSEGTGLMSLSEINNTIDSAVSPMARTTTAPTGNTTAANSDYKNLLEQNKNQQLQQLQQNWQTQEEAHNQQVNALKGQYEQSKLDAENAYQDSVNKLNENRYNQMEDLNVSGTRRGIQYSPQQLGLENVANINHNKNLVETSKTRNELLNKLQIEMNNSLAQLNIALVNARNEYNKNILDINTNYNNTLMGWNREDALTQDNRDYEQKLLEEKRAWEEAQKLKDQEYEKQLLEEKRKWEEEQKKQEQEYEKMMQELQNSWQSNENQLDRNHQTELNKSRSSSGYSGYGGYSSYGRSYGGYGSYGSGSYGVSTASLDDDIEARAYQSTFNDVSDDAYSGYTSLMSPYNASSRAIGYASEVDEMIEYAKKNGASEQTIKNLYNTRDKAMKQLFEDHSGVKNYGGDIIKRGDDKVQFYKKNVTNSLDQMKARQAETIMKKLKTTTTKKNTSTTNKSTTKKNTSSTIKKVSQNIKNKQTKSSKNTQKAITNSKNNSKKAGSNALKNLKKNISKLFKKK